MLHQFLSLSHPSASNINCFSRRKREGVGWERECVCVRERERETERESERESVGECVCFLVPLPTGFGNSQCQFTIILPTLRLISASSKWRKKKKKKNICSFQNNNETFFLWISIVIHEVRKEAELKPRFRRTGRNSCSNSWWRSDKKILFQFLTGLVLCLAATSPLTFCCNPWTCVSAAPLPFSHSLRECRCTCQLCLLWKKRKNRTNVCGLHFSFSEMIQRCIEKNFLRTVQASNFFY